MSDKDKSNVESLSNKRAEKLIAQTNELLKELENLTDLKSQEEEIAGLLEVQCTSCNAQVKLPDGLYEPPDMEVYKCSTCRNHRFVHLANGQLFCEICGSLIDL